MRGNKSEEPMVRPVGLHQFLSTLQCQIVVWVCGLGFNRGGLGFNRGAPIESLSSLSFSWSVFQKNILKNELVVSSKIPPKKNPQKTVGFDVLILTNFYCLIPQKKWGPSASPLDPFTSGGAPPGGAPALAGGSPPGGPWKRGGKFYTPK